MTQKQKKMFDIGILVGLVIIAAGVLFLLEELGADIPFNVWDFWPVIIIVIGIGKLLQPREQRGLLAGVVITAIGALLLMKTLDVLDFDIHIIWPILIILVGFSILRHAVFGHGHRPCCPPENKTAGTHPGHNGKDMRKIDDQFVNVSAVLGGIDYNYTAKNLTGGKATAIMGGGDLSFRDAEMAEDVMIMEVFILMGGMDVRVPRHWQVVVEGSPILGAIENKTAPEENPTKKLVIRGTVIMGAVEVKN